jgi:hypothetical protein
VHNSVNIANQVRKQSFPGPGALTAENVIERSLKWQQLREEDRVRAQEVLRDEQLASEWGEEFVPTKEELEQLEKETQEKVQDTGPSRQKSGPISGLVSRFWDSRTK